METNQSEMMTDKIGMWVFLASEVFFFSALFTAFIVYYNSSPAGFHLGMKHMNFWAGTINTALLLTSSLGVALASFYYKSQKFKLSLVCLVISLTLGTIFLLIKGYEYFQHVQEHLIPGYDFQFTGEHAQSVKMFFLLYFIMTGIHALHLIIGLSVLVFVTHKVFQRTYHPPSPRGLELATLYWHFVDLVWVFLFPLLYLGSHS